MDMNSRFGLVFAYYKDANNSENGQELIAVTSFNNTRSTCKHPLSLAFAVFAHLSWVLAILCKVRYAFLEDALRQDVSIIQRQQRLQSSHG